MKLRWIAWVLWLVLSLVSCGRANGESCWSDDECASNYCSWDGECTPSLLELLAELFESDAPPVREPPPPPPPVYVAPEPPPCVAMEEQQCRESPACEWFAICSDEGDPEGPDIFECEREYRHTLRCPAGCFIFGGWCA